MKALIRRYFIIIIGLTLVIDTSKAQNMSDFYQAEELTWYGIDFSQARFINFRDELSPTEIKELVLNNWTLDPLTEEHEKVIRKRFHKKVIKSNIEIARQRNTAAEFADKIVSEGYDMTLDEIKKILSGYKIKGNGYGILLVVEGFEKVTDYAYIWILFIDERKGEILGSTRSLCRAFIGGMDERWLGAIKYSLEHGGNYLKSYR